MHCSITHLIRITPTIETTRYLSLNMVDFSTAPENNTDSFDVHINVILRILVALTLGIWGWALNLQIMGMYGIDVETILGLKYARPAFRPVYRLALFVSIMLVFWILLFWVSVAIAPFDVSKATSLTVLDVFPWVGLFVFMTIIGVGWRTHDSGRFFFLKSLFRVSLGGLSQQHRVTDIILSDALTSYSRVVADLAVCVLGLWYGITSIKRPDRGIGGSWFVPCVTAVPYLIRLRQCLIDYSRDGRHFHLVNALKYCSTLPVLVLGTLMKTHPVRNVWLVAALINSSFSFIWDIKCDWNLSILQDLWDGELNNGGLRKTLVYPKWWYYTAMVVDLVLRFTWTLKFTSSWSHVHDYEAGIFVFQLLEISRRWMWIFFRVENEWVKAVDSGDVRVLEGGIQMRGEHED
ncbi:EXS family-domain-containing protein [Yarrowia lipolytica]|nr:EXS family-domain-containing protein [Yarrowia lipolytica]